MRILCAYRVPRFCHRRLQGECNLCSRQGFVERQARPSLAWGKLANIIQVWLLQEKLLVIGMSYWFVKNFQISEINLIMKWLLGYRCEWCGLTTHGGCRHFVQQECTFGQLQPIYLPPHAVSIPRTEVPMEAIIGVQVKSKTIPIQREYSCRKCHRPSP
jgi:hypothetical protein